MKASKNKMKPGNTVQWGIICALSLVRMITAGTQYGKGNGEKSQEELSDLREDLLYLKTHILNRLDSLDEKTDWCLSSKGEVFNSKTAMDLLETTQRDVASLLKHTLPKDCGDVEGRTNGFHDIYIGGKAVPVHCSYTVRGPGWTLIQKRVDNTTDFDRTWQEYKEGFGRPEHNFWLGNENIHLLTKAHSYELLINLTLEGGGTRLRAFPHFELLNEQDMYQLIIDASNRKDPYSLFKSNGTAFTTKDRRLPLRRNYLIADRSGGWWHDCSSDMCILAMNQNGLYDGLKDKMTSLSVVEMKIRRV